MSRANAIIVVVVLLAVAAGTWAYRRATEPQRAWRALLALEGRDLLKLTADDRIDAHIAWRRFGGPRDLHNQAFQPFRVLRLNPGSAQERVLMLEVSDYAQDLSLLRMTLLVLDREGGMISSTELDTGRRLAVIDGSIEEGLLRLVSISLTSSRAGMFVQYYGLREDRPLLVRLASSDGKLRRNRYQDSRFDFGPTVPDRTPAEWATELGSGDRLRGLAALVWLGGDHARPPEPGGAPQAAAEPRAVTELRAHPDVVRNLAALRSSPDRWIREAALAVPIP